MPSVRLTSDPLSVIDQAGALRVQHLGVRFDPDELLGDLRLLLREAPPR